MKEGRKDTNGGIPKMIKKKKKDHSEKGVRRIIMKEQVNRGTIEEREKKKRKERREEKTERRKHSRQ